MQFDISSKAKLSLRQIPLTLRDRDGWADTSSLAVRFGDPALDRDPAELWIGSVRDFGSSFLSAGPRQAQDNVARIAQQVHREGGVIITVQSSAQQIRKDRQLYLAEMRKKAANARWHVNSETTATSGVRKR